MIVDVETVLSAPPERVWAEVKTSRLLLYVAGPLIRFYPIEPKVLPDTWAPGRYRVSMWFLGLIPLGRQWVVISEPPAPPGIPDPQETKIIRDEGTGDLVRVWVHWIFIRPRADGSTHYRDRVEVKAGVLTPFIWLFAAWFYRHRQARWRSLVKRGFRYPA